MIPVSFLKAKLRDAEERLHQREAELEEQGKQLKAAQEQAHEAEALAQRLQPMVQQRDKEIHVSSMTHTVCQLQIL